MRGAGARTEDEIRGCRLRRSGKKVTATGRVEGAQSRARPEEKPQESRRYFEHSEESDRDENGLKMGGKMAGLFFNER
jgi:hypothetical protein